MKSKFKQVYILNEESVYLLTDDEESLIRKTVTERKNKRKGISEFTSYWKAVPVEEMTQQEHEKLNALINLECMAIVPIKECVRSFDQFSRKVVHHICQYQNHYSYHVTIGKVGEDRYIEERVVICDDLELFQKYRYGIGSLIRYLD